MVSVGWEKFVFALVYGMALERGMVWVLVDGEEPTFVWALLHVLEAAATFALAWW